LSKAKEDRFKLFKATKSNFSQVFSLYSDPEKKIDQFLDPVHSTYPVIDVEFEQVQNQLWQISDPMVIDGIASLMESKQVLIADGHHRYETGLAYRELMRSQNPNHTGTELYNYIMMFFTNLDDEGLVIFPTHRVIHSLPKYDGGELTTKLQEHFALQIFPRLPSKTFPYKLSPILSEILSTARLLQTSYAPYLPLLQGHKPSFGYDYPYAEDYPRAFSSLRFSSSLLGNIILMILS